jgi:hypothetical protein
LEADCSPRRALARAGEKRITIDDLNQDRNIYHVKATPHMKRARRALI